MALTTTVTLADTLGKHATVAEAGLQVDRIITDIPSFPNRWTGSGGAGRVNDCVSSVIHLIKNNLKDTGTATISVTGDALTRFNDWFDNQSDWEEVPGSEFTVYKPVYRNRLTNKHFWTREDDWTYVRTIRKVGSDYTVSWSNWPGIKAVSQGGDQFPMPDTRDDYTTSAFRLGIHQGILESREYQNWLAENSIQYNEHPLGDNTVVAGVIDPGQIFEQGWVIAPSDFALFTHVPKRLYPIDALTPTMCDYLNSHTRTKPIVNETFGVNQIQLLHYIYKTHCNQGDWILDPFAGAGSGVIAAHLSNMGYIGWEYDFNRGRTAQLAGTHMSNLS